MWRVVNVKIDTENIECFTRKSWDRKWRWPRWLNKFVFHIFLYPPINTHFLYCRSQKYQFSLAFQSAEDHLLTALDYHSRILQNQYHWWGAVPVAKEPNKSRRFTLFFLQIMVTFSMISEIGITFMIHSCPPLFGKFW